MSRKSTNEGLYAKHRLRMNVLYGFASPFRIGISVGESGEDLPNPYEIGKKSHKNYADGIEEGKCRLAEANRSTK